MAVIQRRWFLGALPAVSMAAGKRGEPIHPPDAAFLRSLPELMELASVPGVGIGVVRAGRPLWEHYAGVMNASTKEPVTAESLFPGCSLGKPVFACLVLKLAEEKKFDLDQPLNKYLSDDPLGGQFGDKVTARHVLSHSTGLYNWRWKKDQKLVPDFEPGTRFRYSGEGFYHLQRVVERVLKTGLESAMQERIFRPLGMTSSTYLWREDANRRLVAGHNPDPMYNRDLAMKVYELIRASGEPLSAWNHERISEAIAAIGKSAPPPNEIVPNVSFSLLTTVGDYGRFVAACLEKAGGVLGLGEATRTAMQNQATRINSALGWGLGLGIEQAQGRKYLWQWGDNGGWKDFALAEPATGSALVVFTNGRNGMHVNERVARAATGLEHPTFLWV